MRSVVYSGGRSYSGFEEQMGKEMEKNGKTLEKSDQEPKIGLQLERNVRARFLLMRGMAWSTAHAKGRCRKIFKKITDQVTTEFMRGRGHGIQAHVE